MPHQKNITRSHDLSSRHRRRSHRYVQDLDDKGTKNFLSNILALSLFLILFAFFIVMNAVSEFETAKVAPVMRSVEDAFSLNLEQTVEDIAPSMTPSVEASIYEGYAEERIKALFTSQIPGFQSRVKRDKGVLMIRAPYEDLRAAVLAVGQKNALEEEDKEGLAGAYFLPTLVALMKAEEAGVPYTMEMLMNIDPSRGQGADDEKVGLTGQIINVSLLSTKLEQAGIPSSMIYAGVQYGQADTVDIYFRPAAVLQDGGQNDE